MPEPSKVESEEKRPPFEPRQPQWVSYAPPRRSLQARLKQGARRYAFPAALLLSLAVVVGVLLFYAPLRVMWWGGTNQPAPATAADPPSATSPDPYAGETAFSVASQPAGAEVVLGTDTLGMTPLEQRATRAGAYVLSVSKDGYAAVDSVIFLRSDQPLALHLRLAPEERASEENVSEEDMSEESDSALPRRAGRSAAMEDSSTSAEEGEASKARAAAQRRAEQYRALRDEGDRLYARRKFEAAIQHYQAALRYRPGDEYATKRIQESHKRSNVVAW